MGDYLTSFPKKLQIYKNLLISGPLQKKRYSSLCKTLLFFGTYTDQKRNVIPWWMTGSKALPSETLSLEILGNKIEQQKTK